MIEAYCLRLDKVAVKAVEKFTRCRRKTIREKVHSCLEFLGKTRKSGADSKKLEVERNKMPTPLREVEDEQQIMPTYPK